MTALLIALTSALLGAGFTWLLGSPDRAQAKKSLEAQQAAADAQLKIVELEAERTKREFFLQFSPKAHFHFNLPPVGNVLQLEAAEPFAVDSIHYLNGSNASVGSEELGKAGISIQIPISDEYINKVQRVGPLHNNYDGSAPMQFRLLIRKDGMSKEIVLSAVIKPELIQATPGQLWGRKQ